MNQIVCFRFGEKYWVTDFLQPNNPDIQEKAKELGSIDDISDFIRDRFKYPLNKSLPSSDGTFYRYSAGGCKEYFCAEKTPYMWSFPAECLLPAVEAKIGFGICIDTSLLCTSLLLAAGFDAWTALGELRKTSDNSLLGYHAWTVYNDSGTEKLDETTAHIKDVNVKIVTSMAYDDNSDWAKGHDIYYVEHARFNAKEYIGTTELGGSGVIIELLSLPKSNFLMAGIFGCKINRSSIHKAWQKDELQKVKLLEKVYANEEIAT